MRNSKTFKLVLVALFTAITAVLSGLSIPLPLTPVPLSLATFGVLLCGGILGYKHGSLAMLLYLLLGTFGVPIFSGYEGGIGKVLGPTGGYIVGYIACAFILGLFVDINCKVKEKPNFVFTVIGGVLGTAACYILGTLWFMHVTKNPMGAAIMMCVVPFLVGDIIKIIVSSVLIVRLRPLANSSNKKPKAKESSSISEDSINSENQADNDESNIGVK